MPNLYSSPHNWNRHYITWHLICSHLLENYKLVPQTFHLFIEHLFVYIKKNPKRQMTLFNVMTKYLHIFYSLSYCLMLKIHQWPQSPPNVSQLHTNVQIIFYLIFPPMSIDRTFSQYVSPPPPQVKSILFILFVAPWRPTTFF